MDARPIGVFDSGVGGLTVARAIIDQLPNESISYVGDTLNSPYGPKSLSEVRKLAGGKRVDDIEDVLSVGQKIQVEITKIDDRGKLSLSPVLDEVDTPASGEDG